MGCCSSTPVDDDAPQVRHQNAPPQTRRTPQTITSRTAINGAVEDSRPRSLAPPSALSIQHSETSRSGLSTPRDVDNDARSRLDGQGSLADPYNLPLKTPKSWKSRNRTWTRAQLHRERYEYFETRVTGHKQVWDGLKQVLECLRQGNLADAQVILDALSVTLPTGRLEDGAYDEHGNLYTLPQAVISDPTDVVEDITDADAQTVLGTSDIDVIAAKLESAEGGNQSEEKHSASEEKSKAAKGKTAVRNAVKVKCRLSDRGSPECDVTVMLGRSEKVGLLADRIEQERQMPSNARMRFAYLGKMLDATQTLEQQNWREGDMIQALVTGNWR